MNEHGKPKFVAETSVKLGACVLACVACVFKNLREGNETGSDLELTAGHYFSPHPLPLLAHPLSTSSQFFAHPRRARSLARFFTRLFSSPPGKGKESTSATQATCVSNISSPRLKRRYTRYGFLFLIFLAYTTARCLKKFEGVYLIMNHRKSLLFGYYKRGFRYLEFNLLSPCFDLKVF